MDEEELNKLLDAVKQKLDDAAGPIKQTAEKALKESKATGELSQDTKNKVDELLDQQGKLTEAQQKLEERLEGISSENSDLRQELAERQKMGGVDLKQTLGQAFVGSDEIKNWIKDSGKGTAHVDIANAITTATTAPLPDQRDEVVGLPMRSLRIRGLLSPGNTSSNMVKYRKQTVRTNNAAPRAETAASAESDYQWAEADAPVRSVAHHINVSEESYEDTDFLSGEIDSELIYGLDLKEDAQLLTGDGTGQNLSGLITEATAYSAAFAPTSPTMIDTIRLALLQASLADYPADGIVLHPTDWAYIELLKDSQNRYIIANPQANTAPTMWSRPVVETQSITEDKFLVGAFRSAATIYDRKTTEVLISSEHSDNFIKGMLTVQATKRLALAIKRPAALVYGDLGRIA